jgi:tetratricopeptide (TPR) repeat protein
MANRASRTYTALKEFMMRFTPAALALSLLAGVTASATFGADREPDPRAVRLVNEGRSELAAGQVEAAIDSFEAALAVDPSYTNVYLQLGEAARKQGLQGKAIHFYREVLEREPHNFGAISGEGQAMLEKGAIEKARRNLAELETQCGVNCPETRQLAAELNRVPQAGVLTAEAVRPDTVVTQK